MENKEQVIKDFNEAFNPFGSLDMGVAIDVFSEVHTGYECDIAGDLYDLIQEQADSMDMKMEDMDVVATVFEHILQTARNLIDKVIKYDLSNDFDGDTAIYVAGNYMATSFDYSEEAKDELTEKLDNATTEQIETLKESKEVIYLTESLEIEF